ncbi:hypothetical protein D3C71_1844260 [compost metagenome]
MIRCILFRCNGPVHDILGRESVILNLDGGDFTVIPSLDRNTLAGWILSGQSFAGQRIQDGCGHQEYRQHCYDLSGSDPAPSQRLYHKNNLLFNRLDQ